MAERTTSTTSTARVAEQIRRAVGLGPDALRPEARPAALPSARVPAAAPQPGNRSARAAGGRDHRLTGTRRGNPVPAHRPRRVPGRG